MAIGATITIAAAILLDERDRMLVVRKRGSAWFMQPGGKIEASETPVEALRRELAEEVALDIDGVAEHGVFSAPAVNEAGATVVAHIFSGRLTAMPRLGGEIEALDWVNPRAPGALPLAPLTRDMLPLAERLMHHSGELR